MEKRINILGPTASGKSRLTLDIVQHLQLPSISTDFLRFPPNPNNKIKKISEEEILESLAHTLKLSEWVVEGKFISEEILERATVIVWLHMDLGMCVIQQWERFLKDQSQRKQFGLANNAHLTINIIRQHLELYTRKQLEQRTVYTYSKAEKTLKPFEKKVIRAHSHIERARALQMIIQKW